MGSRALIAANNNIFNKAILEEDAFYFSTEDEVLAIISSINKNEHQGKIENNVLKNKNIYNWELINKKYLEFLIKNHNEYKGV